MFRDNAAVVILCEVLQGRFPLLEICKVLLASSDDAVRCFFDVGDTDSERGATLSGELNDTAITVR